MASLGLEERKLTESFYAEFGREALEFENATELAWMSRHGYPLPRDIIESNRLSDAELQARLDAGDAKAGLFLLDRMAKRANGVSSIEAGNLANRLLEVGGPFGGYAYYRYFRDIRGHWADALAGLLWAFQQGDWRAEELFSREIKTGGRFGERLEAGDIAMAYVALLAGMDVRNPALRGRRIDPLIIYRTERP